MSIVIKKAKIVKGKTLDVSFAENIQEGSAKVDKSCESRVHEDLKIAFKALDGHLATLCYQYDKKGKVVAKDFSCTGFTISGSGDQQGVVLFGTRTLPNDKQLNITSPFQQFDGDFFSYTDIEDLSDAIETCKAEVYSYLFESKHGTDGQMEMVLDEIEEAAN